MSDVTVEVLPILGALGKEGPFWGGTNTASFALLLMVHFIAMVMIFGPTLSISSLIRKAERHGGEHFLRIARDSLRRMVVPGIVLSTLAGTLLAVGSKGAFSLGDPWISIAFTVMIVLLVLVFGVMMPGLNAMCDHIKRYRESPYQTARKRVVGSTMVFHVALIVLLYVMLWKPGHS